VKWSCISRDNANALKNLEINSDSQLEVTCEGTLYLEKMSCKKITASLMASIDLWVGINMACLVSLSTTTRMSVYLRDLESCSMKSINMDSQGCGGIGNCLSKP